MNTKITVGLILALIAAAAQTYGILRGKRTDDKQDSQKDITNAVNLATQFANITVKLDNLGQKVSDMQRSSDKTNEKIDIVSSQMARQDERINTLLIGYEECKRRLDALEKTR